MNSGSVKDDLERVIRQTGQDLLATYSAANLEWVQWMLDSEVDRFTLEFRMLGLGEFAIHYKAKGREAIEAGYEMFWSDTDAETFSALLAQFFEATEV